ncbi:unnamed protein product [Mytilus coruscus]|uniref:TIR domain-containing protein n=1 Tax=Mytilus coruscus TaxID=42192 RepID=A0A6J8AER3_MYTCO|nr:unnamed protein product [Mytilus coruscus]
MPQPIEFDTDYDYPDHVFGILTELSFFGIDMMPLPHFGSGFGQMTTIKQLHFESCYLVRLSNKTFQRFSSSVEQLTLRNCGLHFVATEDNALFPFPKLHVIDFFGTFMHLKHALQLLHPYRNANITTINFGHVSDVSIDRADQPYVLTITVDIMKNLCVILPKSLEKIDVSYTIGHTFPEILLIIPKNNSLTYLDVSYSRTYVAIIILQIRLETFIANGVDYAFARNQMKRPSYNTLKTIVWQNADLNNAIRQYENHFFESVRSVESMDISENDIWYFPEDILKPMSNLTCLFLSKNSLQSIPVQLSDHIKVKMLDVRTNRLTSVSSAIRGWADKMQELHGMTLHLTGNAFECNCDNIDFIRWIQTTKVDLDSRSYQCKLSNGTVIDTLIAYNFLYDLFADCKNTMWLTIAFTLLSTFITISLLLLAYSKRWKIIFSIYGVIRRVVERQVWKRYQYDVYISYEGDIVIWIKMY